MKLEFWDKTSMLYLADGTPCEPEEVKKKWPFSAVAKTVLEKAGDFVMAIDSLPMLESIYQIDPTLSDNEKLAEIEKYRLRALNPQYDDIEEAIAILKGEIE